MEFLKLIYLGSWLLTLTLLGCGSAVTPPLITQSIDEGAQKIELSRSLDLALSATLKAKKPLSYFEVAFLMTPPKERKTLPLAFAWPQAKI